jgi:hypothetical protein
MMSDGQVSDRQAVLQAIRAVVGPVVAGAVSADRDRRGLFGASGPLGSVTQTAIRALPVPDRLRQR